MGGTCASSGRPSRIEEEFSGLAPALESSIGLYDETISATAAEILELRSAIPPSVFAQIQPQAKAVLTDLRSHLNEAVEWSVDPEPLTGDEAILRFDLARLRKVRAVLELLEEGVG